MGSSPSSTTSASTASRPARVSSRRPGSAASVVTQRVDCAPRLRPPRRGRARAVDRRTRAPAAPLPRRRRATCSSPTSARRAWTSRSPTSRATSSSTERSLPTSRPVRTRCSPASRSSSTSAWLRPAPCRGASGGSGSASRARSSSSPRCPISPPIMPGWDGYDVRERFAGRGVPVWLDNDVNVMALGELTRRLRPRRQELRLRQDRHRDRRGHRRGRTDPPRRPGLGGRRRSHPRPRRTAT